MEEIEARAFATEIETDSPYWYVEDVFQTADSGKWAILLRHALDTPTQLYVWEKTPQTLKQIPTIGAEVTREYEYGFE